MAIMKRMLAICIIAAIVLSGVGCSKFISPVSYNESTDELVSCVRYTPAVVSTDWLYSKLRHNRYIVVDVRSADEYANGNIPNSINIPFDIISVWAQTDFSPGGIWLELPELKDFLTQLGEHGISSRSNVVLVTSLPTEANPFSLAAPTRVALTLAHVGLNNVSILDGGFDKWAGERKPVTTDVTNVTPLTYHYHWAPDLFVDIDYVEGNLGKVTLVDARDANVYSGEITEDFASKPGHIPTAVSIPAPSFWNEDGTYKSRCEMQRIVRNIIGCNRYQEVVVYCGVGGYASTVWYVLTKILHYSNVKVYDGSAQEWALTNDMEM